VFLTLFTSGSFCIPRPAAAESISRSLSASRWRLGCAKERLAETAASGCGGGGVCIPRDLAENKIKIQTVTPLVRRQQQKQQLSAPGDAIVLYVCMLGCGQQLRYVRAVYSNVVDPNQCSPTAAVGRHKGMHENKSAFSMMTPKQEQ
jgi:hypothetical protein